MRHRLFWRPFWKITHYFNWHYMKVFGPFEDGRRQAWCQWCGLRDWVYDPEEAQKQLAAMIGPVSHSEKDAAHTLNDGKGEHR